MKKSTLSALIIGASLGGGWFTSRYGIAEIIVDKMLKRDDPKKINEDDKLLKKELGDFSEMMHSEPDYFAKVDMERITTTSSDGTKLVGYLHRAKKPERIIIAFHGRESTWRRNYQGIGKFFNEENCTVLYIDQRATGAGESGGDYKGFGMLERHDCLAWVEKVNEITEESLPIYLYGTSMGASTVLMASGFGGRLKNVKGIIADSGFTSAKAVLADILQQKYKVSYRWMEKPVDAAFRRRIGLPADGYTTLDAMRTNIIPILFIHGMEDTFVSMNMTMENYKACTAPKELLLIPDATHCMGFTKDPESYKAAVKNFFKTTIESEKPE